MNQPPKTLYRNPYRDAGWQLRAAFKALWRPDWRQAWNYFRHAIRIARTVH